MSYLTVALVDGTVTVEIGRRGMEGVTLSSTRQINVMSTWHYVLIELRSGIINDQTGK